MVFTPTQTQTDPQCDGDVVPLAPTDSWTGVEQALAKLAQDASRNDRRVEMDSSAGLRAAPVEITLSRADVKTGPLQHAMPSLGRQAALRIARWLIAAAVGAAATLGYQSYGGSLQGVMARWGLVRTEPAAAELGTEQTASGLPPAQATPEQAAPALATPAAQSTPDMVAPVTPADSQQLEALARDVAAVRQMLEQLAAGQEQMAREIAKLQSAEQGVPHRTVLPPPRPATAPARKPVSAVPPPPDRQMSSAASAPPDQQPAPPPPSANVPTPPFRPPMPVPVSPEARAF